MVMGVRARHSGLASGVPGLCSSTGSALLCGAMDHDAAIPLTLTSWDGGEACGAVGCGLLG